jgi:glycosyltransferase involved in cell wall biosynthesis
LVDICHLNLAARYHGGERQTELLVRELAARGYAQRLVVRRGHTLADRCQDVENLEIREVASNVLAASLAVKGAALAHSHEGRTVYSCLIANLLYGTPYLITRRVVAQQSRSFVRSLAYRRAAAIVAVSRATVAEMHKCHPGVEAIVVSDALASFPVNATTVDEIRAARPGKTLIGHVGALNHSHKGQSTIIDVARNVAESHQDWHFILCGDGHDETRFRQEIGELTNIELVGWVDNVGDYLSAFDLFVYPSLHEALGSALLDAMQFGLPIVATNVGGIPEIVEDGVNGKLVEPENVPQLQAGIEAMLSDDASLQRMRAANAAKSQNYGVTPMADAYETLYREIQSQV